MDSTSSCHAENHAVTFILTPCAADAVPLGIIITTEYTHDVRSVVLTAVSTNHLLPDYTVIQPRRQPSPHT
jgi:hypothetical protein